MSSQDNDSAQAAAYNAELAREQQEEARRDNLRTCDGYKCGNVVSCLDDDEGETWFEIRGEEETQILCPKCYDEMLAERDAMEAEYREHQLKQQAIQDGAMCEDEHWRDRADEERTLWKEGNR